MIDQQRRSRVVLRAVATAAVSMLSLVAAAWYIATPVQTVLAINMHKTAAFRVFARHEVIYGSARDAAGHPIRGVQIMVEARTGKRLRVLVSFKTAANGTARRLLALPSGRYLIKVVVKRGRSSVTAIATIRLRPGTAYLLTIRERRSGGLFVLPVRGY